MGNPRQGPMLERARWFDPKKRNKNYDDFGDAYDDSKYHELAAKWNKDTKDGQDYLRFVKQASKTQWIHLRLLADFMQIGKIPREWNDEELSMPSKESVKICVLEYFQNDRQPEVVRYIETAHSSKPGSETKNLEAQFEAQVNNEASFRLYVVEDLSKDVIELLGTKLGIEPDFFRAHIVDYAWYNIRDRWRDNQPLELVRRRRDWWQIRYVAARYFEDEEALNDAAREAKENFNILRRPDNDKSRGWWDISGPASTGDRYKSAAVALTRSRATFWLKPTVAENDTAIGVLLLDPTVSNGFPLWRGHGNFHPVPWPSTVQDKPAEWPSWTSPSHEDSAKRSFFEDFVYWARQPGLSALGLEHAPKEQVPVLVLLNLVGSEWLIMCEYIKTRLNQIDMETIDPSHLSDKKLIDTTLEKLHIWRRLIPLYREMVSETLQHFFSFSLSKLNKAQPEDPSGQPSTAGCPHCPQAAATLEMWDIRAYEEDYKLVLARLEEYQSRIDRLTSVVTAVMAVEDTRRAIMDARNIGFLTWLATFFIPFGVFSGI
ncbi:hypothetical protein DHEL01_v209799 [Diaporthe helianthi]|uniref:CorA-like Mg2+ transporter n=1 Tax=Diaporthe helianthi TaxID=158607 RepID=A0A2P5HNJ3_DIAHE|nr:hypothetical protein DHEL01_v209799 [Diaporthe helianthi]